MRTKRIAVLISGSGTNLQALIDACELGEINGEIRLIVSNVRSAYGLERGKAAGIETMFLSGRELGADYDAALLRELGERGIDLVVLAGYLRILGPELVRYYSNRIINIHPALIPAFCGPGHYGMRVHEAVHESGVKVTGATVHFVDEGVDSGPIIFQESVPVADSDRPEDIQRNVLSVEHGLLVRAVAAFCADQLTINGRRVTYTADRSRAPIEVKL